jgi:SAM-dependent methyltransferase
MQLSDVVKIEAAYRSATMNRQIAPNDHMWASGKDWYFPVGTYAIDIILRGLALSSITSVNRVLDLPCGHGRVTRHLRAAFPDAEMYVCDLDKTGVEFCAREFRTFPVYSLPELTDVDLPKNLDLIWVGSLFTHVDEIRTKKWLNKLARHLAPHGLLVSTFHGLFSEQLQKTFPMIDPQSWMRILDGYNRTGFGYAKYTDIDMGDYGISLSRPSKIMEIATSIPETRVLAYTERGWAGNQDVLIMSRYDRLLPF